MPDRRIFVCLGPWITMDIGWKLWAKTTHNTTTGGFGFTQDQSNWSWRSTVCSIIHASVLEPQCKFWKLRLSHNPGWQSSLHDVTHCVWEGLMSVESTGREWLESSMFRDFLDAAAYISSLGWFYSIKSVAITRTAFGEFLQAIQPKDSFRNHHPWWLRW